MMETPNFQGKPIPPMLKVGIPLLDDNPEEEGRAEPGTGLLSGEELEFDGNNNGNNGSGEEEEPENGGSEKEEAGEGEKPQKKVRLPGVLLGDKVLIRDGQEFYEKNGFGDLTENGLEVCPEEALYLLEKKRITVSAEGAELDFNSLLDRFRVLYVDIYIRYQVFRNLRDRGLVVRSGLKYGTHFRAYERGVRPKKGVRAPWEHAKYLIHAISEGQTYTVPEMARFVRLAHSVKKKLWLAIVDGEGDVTYYQIIRVTP